MKIQITYKRIVIVLAIMACCTSVKAVILPSQNICVDYPRALAKILPQSIYNEFAYVQIPNANVNIQNDSLFGLSTGSDSVYFFNSLDSIIAQMEIFVQEYVEPLYVQAHNDTLFLSVGQSLPLDFFSYPPQATIYDTLWMVTDTLTATVKGGILTAKQKGHTKIKTLLVPSETFFYVDIFVDRCTIEQPEVTKNVTICFGDTAIFFANSTLAHWYSDSLLENEISSGAVFIPEYTQEVQDTFYVTKEEGNCVSEYQEVFLQVENYSEAINTSLFPNLIYFEDISTIDFGQTINWYTPDNLLYPLYRGTSLPDSIETGIHEFYLTAGSECESPLSSYFFSIVSQSDSIRIAGILTDVDENFSGTAMLIEYPDLIIQKQVPFNGNQFEFRTKKSGEYLVKVEPDKQTDYGNAVYYGNTPYIDNAYILPVHNYNIWGLEIELESATNIEYISNKTSIYYHNRILYANCHANEKYNFTIISFSGNICMSGTFETGINTILLNDFSSGVYALKISDRTFQFVIE